MLVHQLVYHSRARLPADRPALGELRDILKVSRANNARDDLTGYLVFDGEAFVQVLEGPGELVQATYARVLRDPRHDGARVVDRRDLWQRGFAGWSMRAPAGTTEARAALKAHGFEPGYDPARLTGPLVLALARDLEAAAAQPAARAAG